MHIISERKITIILIIAYSLDRLGRQNKLALSKIVICTTSLITEYVEMGLDEMVSGKTRKFH